jgi:hypothetical protein
VFNEPEGTPALAANGFGSAHCQRATQFLPIFSGHLARRAHTLLRNLLRSDTPKHLRGCRYIPCLDLPEGLFVVPSRSEGLGFRTPQLGPVVAGASPTVSGEFYVPFFVLVINHEHKE